MLSQNIDGQLFKKAMLAGMTSLKNNVEEVNDLNVFPIPDGDTGENMGATLYGGIKAIKDKEETSLDKMANEFAHGALMSARGNSGVILSQMFAGIAKGFEHKSTADIEDIAYALKEGVKRAYESVAKPVEGTMLTVLREATEYASIKLNKNSTLKSFFKDFEEELEKSLERTPDLLFCLKEAGVVDSGGKGVVYIVDGIVKIVNGENVEINQLEIEGNNKNDVDLNLFTENDVMKFGYCTEFLMRLQTSKVDVENFSVDELIKYLSTIGDSIVAFKTGTIVKVHVHTMTPGKVFNYCQQYGEFLTLKVENMTLQHNESVKPTEKVSEKPKYKKNLVRKQFGFISVATGDGIKNAYKDLGVDIIIDGGQCKNPSIDDFIEAFDAVNADEIFVLPNNGNVIMAANSAKEMYTSSKVHVINSKNMGDGYSALMSTDLSSSDSEEIENQLNENMQASTSAMITKSIRTVTINDVDIVEGNYIGFKEKEMLCSFNDKNQTLYTLLEKLNTKEKNFLIVFYGKDVTDDEKNQLEKKLSVEYSNIEFYGIDGGQEVYDYILILQ